ncbi:MAG: 3-dehydroquinate synthase [Verrucomicrobiota bacterium]
MTPAEIYAEGPSNGAVIGAGLLEASGESIAKQLAGPICTIITDTNVASLFGDRLRASLSAAGFRPALIAIPPAERFKTLEQVGAICDQMIAAGLDRQSFVVGLGGGVIGDISGFVAAIFHRGIPHVQIPTTLLAMVDSSIGGKTGVNTAAGKNLLGAIHPPLLVIDDVDVLRTLPQREFNQGFAEIIKHAIIADAEMFSEVARASGLRTVKIASETLAPLIQRNIEIKRTIVAEDEMDRTGQRALLNFGHTVGHAIERAGEYRQLLHGEAVSLGMVAACQVSVKRAGLRKDEAEAVTNLLQRFDLPTRLPKDFPRQKIFDALPFDKKFEHGKIRFVVTPKLGTACLSSDIIMQDIEEAVAQL